MYLTPEIVKTKAGYHLRFIAENGKKIIWSEKYQRIAPCYKITTYFGWAKREVEVIDLTKKKRI